MARVLLLFAFVATQQGFCADLNQWILQEEKIATERLLESISPDDGVPGSNIASPSRKDPDYYYHWIRDAALVFSAVVDLYEKSSRAEKNEYFKHLMDFAAFSRRNQLTPTHSGGLGEPKFYVDGSAFNQPWGRPQNDGPALRAITLIRFANLLIDEGKIALVREKLYDGKFPTRTVIKEDLEFVAEHWTWPCFDLWEEVKGIHFYTRIVQRRALVDGAMLAVRLEDFGAAEWYLKQAKRLEEHIPKHWNPTEGTLVPTIDHSGGIDYKRSGLDASVVIAALHGWTSDGFFGLTDDKLLSTVARLKEVFTKLYPINQKARRIPGIAIGRYPEDRYDGYTTGKVGNPWVLLTCAFAELYYRIEKELNSRGQISVSPRNLPFLRSLLSSGTELVPGQVIKKRETIFYEILAGLKRQGDDFLRRVQHHTNGDGSLSEQMNRTSGFMQGARDLSWSYAAFLTAIWVR